MPRTLAIALALAGLLALTSSPALSKRGKKRKGSASATAEEPAGAFVAIAKYRHTLLEAVAKHFSMSRAILMGKVDRPDDLVEHARAIHDAATGFTGMFPEGSGPESVPQTDALPSVWTDWASFEEKAKAFERESAKLVEIAEAGDKSAAVEQMKALGQTCGSCHDAHRKDED